MKTLSNFISESILKNTKSGKETYINSIIEHIKNKILSKNEEKFLESQTAIYKPRDKENLRWIIAEYMECTQNNNCSLNWIDISDFTDLSYVFFNQWFNGDISKWNIKNCKCMVSMFENSKFNNDSIKKWDVSNVLNFEKMFYNVSNLTVDLSSWNIYKYANVYNMFANCKIREEYKPKYLQRK